MQCQTPTALLNTFSPKSYAEMVIGVNALTDEFRTLERTHQIARLYAYSNQWGILKKWKNLRRQGVRSLADLFKQNSMPQDIFNMGE
jgi:hypothetical protein